MATILFPGFCGSTSLFTSASILGRHLRRLVVNSQTSCCSHSIEKYSRFSVPWCGCPDSPHSASHARIPGPRIMFHKGSRLAQVFCQLRQGRFGSSHSVNACALRRRQALSCREVAVNCLYSHSAKQSGELICGCSCQRFQSFPADFILVGYASRFVCEACHRCFKSSLDSLCM